ncbi:MAG: acyl carrier protein [Paludibacteraceae bacterium]|nr:acyl carrier protein [Paludibacteraceae bacterium]MBR2261990.1 acyl carrier protein [Paludibacteraceae bacterium]MEE3485273.1 phosphopantetheine-binding protein [Bacteroidales bacterium]
MDRNELIEKVNTVLAEEFEVEVSEISDEKNIKTTLNLDSLSLVDLVALIEEEFSVKIKGTEMTSIQSFGDLYDFLAERVK